MNRIRILLAFSLMGCCVPNVASAKESSFVELGQTVQQNAGDTSDFYRFAGFTGTTVTATVTTEGQVGLVIYTPDGEEMLSVNGEGTVKLDVILPFPDIYFVSVLRTETMQPYTLSITAIEPDRHPAELAEADRLNRDQAAFGARQKDEYEAAKQAYEKAVRDREATIVRQKAEHEAAVEAERLRREREHEAVMARWRADVEACKKGDRTKCAK